MSINLYKCLSISIHAPAKGATKKLKDKGYISDISIHAPAKGATKTLDLTFASWSISIHAPAKGATGFGFIYVMSKLTFQSTLPRRERQKSTTQS